MMMANSPAVYMTDTWFINAIDGQARRLRGEVVNVGSMKEVTILE
jgi:hypothetical protein